MLNNIQVDICNEALVTAGIDRDIASISDNSEIAELCSRLWEPTIREVYSEHAWAFKKVYGQADLLSVGNPHEYSFPDNALRVLGFYKDKGCQVPDKLARVGSKSNGLTVIFSTSMPLFLEYISDATSVDSVSPWLRRCIVYALGIKIKRAKGGDVRDLLQEYQMFLDRAEENNATEDSGYNTYDDKFINCR